MNKPRVGIHILTELGQIQEDQLDSSPFAQQMQFMVRCRKPTDNQHNF